jgi:hypothetical protein
MGNRDKLKWEETRKIMEIWNERNVMKERKIPGQREHSK